MVYACVYIHEFTYKYVFAHILPRLVHALWEGMSVNEGGGESERVAQCPELHELLPHCGK